MLSKERKVEIAQQFGGSAQNTGSAAVQVALLTDRIIALTQHCKTHPKDFSTRRGLLQLVCDRRAFLRYLAKKDFAQYRDIVQKLGLRK